jgi:hypothetical protein
MQASVCVNVLTSSVLRIVLEKLIVTQQVKKYSAFNGNISEDFVTHIEI